MSIHGKSQDDFLSRTAAGPDSLRGKILILNAFDWGDARVRKNKKELFIELADSLKQLLALRIQPQFRARTVIYPDAIKEDNNKDSLVLSLMDQNDASFAIVISDLDVYFEETNHTVEGEKGNKTRTAFYDICSRITYALYSDGEKIGEPVVELCKTYTSRQYTLFSFGPDIVGKSKDAFKATAGNADKFFLSPELASFSQSILESHYKISARDTALKYSLSFADQSQMAYDGGLKLKFAINKSFIEGGDIAYYNGKYFNALARYGFDIGPIPLLGIINDPTPTYINNADLKVYTRQKATRGMLYQTRGKFVKAEADQILAMNFRESRFGKTSPEYLNSLHNLAVLKKDMGLYDESESIFNFLEPVFKNRYTQNSLPYVVLINNKAMLLAELGRTNEAVGLLNEALKLGETVLDTFYFDVERIRTNRAILEQEMGETDKAEADYLKVMDNMERKGYDDHPDYNNIMVYYGSLLVQKNNPDVLNLLVKVADKVKRRYKDDHPMMAKALTNIGDYYLNQKSYEEARKTYDHIAEIQLKVLGEKHKDYLKTLIKLAVCEWRLHLIDKATIHFNKAIHNFLALANAFFLSMSESEKTIYWKMLKPNIDTYLAFVAEEGQANPTLLKDAYNLQLATKGILINAVKQTRNAILGSGDSVIIGLYNEWLRLKNTLSNYYSSPLEDIDEDKVDLAALEQQANTVEKELSKRSSSFKSAYNPSDISFEDIKSKLGKNEIAVEIIRVFDYYGDVQGGSKYIALVVKKDSSSPELVRLGNGSDFEKKYLNSYKKSIINKVPDTASYKRYWQPLEPLLDKHGTIYVSVDGIYNSINLNTLQSNDGTFLLDDYNIVLVPNTKFVAMGSHSGEPLTSVNSPALLFGYPLYGNDELIQPLPGTKEEIQRIDTILIKDHVSTKVFIQQTASEENIKAASHPSILHIATHGFFNENIDLSKTINMGVQVSRAKDNALLRSGLLFNGAASAYGQEPVLEGSNNGILYSNEAMNLDLKGTRLVVLSACETGMGEIVNGEGVYGLSRAFQVAGADKVLMSLWKVDDKTTRELMIQFYQNWLKINDPQKAFLEAQKTIKAKYPQPYYWGGFVLLN